MVTDYIGFYVTAYAIDRILQMVVFNDRFLPPNAKPHETPMQTNALAMPACLHLCIHFRLRQTPCLAVDSGSYEMMDSDFEEEMDSSCGREMDKEMENSADSS